VRALTAFGRILTCHGLHERAVAPMRSAVELARLTHHQDLLADALMVLGLAIAFCGSRLAVPLLDEAADLAVLPRARATALLYRGIGAAHGGDPDLARTLFSDSRAICVAAGDKVISGYGLGNAVVWALAEGDIAQAGTYAREHLPVHYALRDTLGLAMALEYLAWTAAAVHDYRRSARLLGASHRATTEFGGSPVRSPRFVDEHETCEWTVRAAVGSETFGAEFRRGAALTPGERVQFALAPEHAPAADVPGPRRAWSPPVSGSPITRREQEIAALVAEGLSNRQIAAQLVISPRTAEGHVQNILVKLGFGARSEIAAWYVSRS
jgi:non-specific serine/threonine protein kinase